MNLIFAPPPPPATGGPKKKGLNNDNHQINFLVVLAKNFPYFTNPLISFTLFLQHMNKTKVLPFQPRCPRPRQLRPRPKAPTTTTTNF